MLRIYLSLLTVFDYVTCLGSLEHFPNPERGVREISRVLKKNAKALIFVPNLFFLGHIYMAFRYGIEPSEANQNFSEIFKTRKGWEELFEKNGLKVLNCYKYNTIWASTKVSSVTKILYNYLLKPFIPLNLSYSFLFICEKKY
jgi:SAM-dependent methyltransferase